MLSQNEMAMSDVNYMNTFIDVEAHGIIIVRTHKISIKVKQYNVYHIKLLCNL